MHRHILPVFFLFLVLPFYLVAATYPKTKIDSLRVSAIEHSRYGRFEQSNKDLKTILDSCKTSPKFKKEIYGLLCINADLVGDYTAYQNYISLKEGRCKKESDEMRMVKQMAAQKPQVVERPDNGDVTVKYLIDSLYYEGKYAGCEIRLPVTIDGKDEYLILDNGCAKYCVASEKFAVEHNIKPLGAEGKAVGVVESVSMWFGIADSLTVGGMKFKNILFVVIPDKFIDNSVLEINAMLGANFFRLAGEMVFDNKEGTLTFPSDYEPREPNVTIDAGGAFYAEAEIDGDMLPMLLDLGSAKTSLCAKYYRNFEDKVKSKWTPDTSHVGGVGGLVQENVYTLPQLEIISCGGTFVKNDIKVSVDAKPNEDDEYGYLGNDFLLSFDKAVLNLNRMYLYVGDIFLSF